MTASPPAHDDLPAHLEIERKYLLGDLPDLPSNATPLRLEQGYLPDDDASATTEGRIRRSTTATGDVTCTHTIKHGDGVTRIERERVISIDEFEQLWSGTEGRRVRKTRYKIPARMGDRDVTWEIDRFDDRALVLAEVELPSADIDVRFPDWLAPHVVREVTDEPAYRNYSLATSGGA
jgi:CYTH domain-containing protein